MKFTGLSLIFLLLGVVLLIFAMVNKDTTFSILGLSLLVLAVVFSASGKKVQ